MKATPTSRARGRIGLRCVYPVAEALSLVLLLAGCGCRGVSEADFEAFKADVARRAALVEESGAELEESIALLGEAGGPRAGVSEAAWLDAVTRARERARAARDEARRLREAAGGER
jgi:hypothetical protein